MEKIVTAKYEGYIWYSDEKEPRVFRGDEPVDVEKFLKDDADRHFVVEGNLWNKEAQESIAIRYVDGQYSVRRTDLSGEGSENATIKTFVAHKIYGVKALEFKQLWEAQEDPMCEGMPVLRPKRLVFVGFKK